MAIKITKALDHLGIPSMPDTYVRVAGFGGNHKTVTADLEVFVNEQARTDEKQAIQKLHVHFPYPENGLMPGDNIFQWLYAALKKTDEFKGGVDV